jgi:hypothetical protein
MGSRGALVIPPLFVFLVPVIREASRAASSGTNRSAFTATCQRSDSGSGSSTNARFDYSLLLSIAFRVMDSLMMAIVRIRVLRLCCRRAANQPAQSEARNHHLLLHGNFPSNVLICKISAEGAYCTRNLLTAHDLSGEYWDGS